MSEYFKFWLAKELVPLVIVAGVVGLFFVCVLLAWLSEIVQKWLKSAVKHG